MHYYEEMPEADQETCSRCGAEHADFTTDGKTIMDTGLCLNCFKKGELY